MQTSHGTSATQEFGEIVAAACELGSWVAADRAMARDLATRHLERVLLHGRNARLRAELADLARELEWPGKGRAKRGRDTKRSMARAAG